MADPKGTYYSPTSPETGWATVIPQHQRSNFFRQMAQIPMADKKAKIAEDKLKQQQLSKLSGDQVGRFHYEAYQKEASKLIAEADKLNTLELTDRIIKLNTLAQATKSVEKLYDTDVKWAQSKEVPIKTDAWRSAYTQKYYANPSLETVNKWAEEAPNKTWFLGEDGGSQYIDGGKAIKKVIKNNFNGYLTDQQWSRSGWEKAPTGHVTDLLTVKHKVNAFSTIQKNAAGNDEIVVKEPKELIGENILGTFMEDEYMARVLTDRAKEMIMQKKGVTQVDDDDVTQYDLAAALQQELVPYLDGAVSESGMTLAIRPPGQGGGGAKEDKWQKGFDLWVYQLSQGSPAAVRYPAGGKIGSTNEEVVSFDSILPWHDGSMTANVAKGQTTPRTLVQIFDNPQSVRANFEKQSWFRSLGAAQKTEVVNSAVASGKQAGENAKALYTFVTRIPVKKDANSREADSYTYSVRVINPETIDRSTLALLYDAGYGARGNVHYNMVVSEGQQGYQYETAEQPQQSGWQPPAPVPNTKATKPKGM